MNKLKFLRIEKNLLQEDVGDAIGVSGRAIGNYETGKRNMSPYVMIKLANFFNVSIDYLLGKSEIRNPEELKKVPFANAGGLDVKGLDEEDLLELQRQIDYIKKMKGKNNERK